MRPYVQLSAVPRGERTNVSVQVFDGDAKGLPARLYHAEWHLPLAHVGSERTVHVHVLQILIAAAARIAVGEYPYPRDAIMTALDHELAPRQSARWRGDEVQDVDGDTPT